jgi:tol-pal system protein YbgF
MQRYKPLILAAAIFLFIGATMPNNDDKELIIRLQGEILVLQRQIRDMQESFDKFQGQSTASLQKISDNTGSTAREMSTIGESLKNVQSSQSTNLAGATVQLQKILEQLSRQNQGFSSLGQQLDALKQSVQDLQQKTESREKSERLPDPTTMTNNPENLFATGYNQYKKGDYESAIRYLRSYLNVQTQSEDLDDALFWIAESQFSLGKYNEALREYDRILSEHPRGDKASQSLLKKGITLLYLERRNEGIAALRSVKTQFPNSPEASQAGNELNRLGEEFVPSSSSTAPPQSRQRPL